MSKQDDDSRLPTLSGPSAGERPSPQPAPDIDGYAILGPLSEGGMGRVWKAVQQGTKREVALKFLKESSFASASARARFGREVELTARLQHPNIARIYDTGVHHGAHFYAMELIDGAGLDEYVRDRALTRRDTLELMRTVCRAVQHAHQRGVIHRDLKPSNILVTPDGQPHVLDFGLAKTFLEDDRGRTISTEGAIAGSIPYMSPEQADGRVNDVTTRSDVYSLGVVLYQLLAGRYPRDMTGSQLEVLGRIAREEVCRPRQACADIDRELEAVLLKALSLDPDGRYASAGELADDIENYLNDEPLTARPPTTVYLLRKRMRKLRLQLSLAAAALLACVIAVGFYIYSVQAEQARTEHARRQAVEQRQYAELNAAKADELRHLALEALNGLVFEVQHTLREDDGNPKLQKELLDIATKHLRRMAASAEDSDFRADRSAGAALVQLGDVFLQAGEAAAARNAYAGGLARLQALHRLNPDDARLKRDLCIANTRLGRIGLRLGDTAGAGEHLRAALAMAEGLLRDSPNDLKLLHNRWAIHICLGDLMLEVNSPAEAREHFERSLSVAEGLARREPSAPTPQRDVSTSCKRLGDACLVLNDQTRAAGHYERALTIDRALAAAGPKSFRARRDLSVSLRKLGEASLQRGRLPLAESRCRESLQIAEALAKAAPDRFEAMANLATVAFVLGDVELTAARQPEAGRHYEQAVSILEQLRRDGKLADQPKYMKLLARARDALGRCRALTATRPAG